RKWSEGCAPRSAGSQRRPARAAGYRRDSSGAWPRRGNMTDRPIYSIVAPVYNEEGNIQPLYDRIREVMDTTGEPWELILVNDGSRDQSLALMEALAEQDERVRVINFARNFGHQ